MNKYRVSHLGVPDAEVTAESSMQARKKAAKLWDVPWENVAMGCTVKNLGSAVEPEVIREPEAPEKKPKTKAAKASAKSEE